MALRHPAHHDFLAYAKCVVDRKDPISANVARHVGGCLACATEVAAMRNTFSLTAQAAELQPTREFTAQLLLAAQQERIRLKNREIGSRKVFGVLRGLAYAAGIALVAAASFGFAIRNQSATEPHLQVAETVQAVQTAFSPVMLNRAVDEIQTFASALNSASNAPQSLWEREHRRIAQALGDDIAAAKSALERNPGCARASATVDTSVQRQAQTLRKLYIQRGM